MKLIGIMVIKEAAESESAFSGTGRIHSSNGLQTGSFEDRPPELDKIKNFHAYVQA